VDSLILGTGVHEKRVDDADGRLTFRNRISDVAAVSTLASDSLFYDKADHLIRARELVRSQQPDQTLIGYDGLGAVVAREQGNQFGSNVEEFRNDAFGNVLRRLTRKAPAPSTALHSSLATVQKASSTRGSLSSTRCPGHSTRGRMICRRTSSAVR
jgi:hypothetical protein